MGIKLWTHRNVFRLLVLTGLCKKNASENEEISHSSSEDESAKCCFCGKWTSDEVRYSESLIQ